MFEQVLLIAAAFGAGVLNAIAGGGTFLTFPALVYAGIPVVAANATSAVTVFPGYLGSVVGFHREIAQFDRGRLIRITLLTAAGGLIGSLLLLVSSNQAFSAVVPFLLMMATLIFAFGKRFSGWMARQGEGHSSQGLGMLLVAIYGGYFNGGLGIVLLALFSLWGMRDLNVMNGLKMLTSFVLSVISLATFALAGIVAWKPAILMMVAAAVGGYAGAPLARFLPAAVVRTVVILVGATLSVVFFRRAFIATG